MLKIIAGEFRSRRLVGPPDASVSRPYAQRVKESVFNHLRGWFEGARVLDLFAGVGTMGLEAVSRGAAEVLMVEQDRRIFRRLQENVATLDCADRATAMCGDALGMVAIERAPRPVDVAFVDPPYAMMRADEGLDRVSEAMGRLRTIMAPKSFVVLRCPFGPNERQIAVDGEEPPAPKSLEIPGFEGPEAHRQTASMWTLFYMPEETR